MSFDNQNVNNQYNINIETPDNGNSYNETLLYSEINSNSNFNNNYNTNSYIKNTKLVYNKKNKLNIKAAKININNIKKINLYKIENNKSNYFKTVKSEISSIINKNTNNYLVESDVNYEYLKRSIVKDYNILIDIINKTSIKIYSIDLFSVSQIIDINYLVTDTNNSLVSYINNYYLLSKLKAKNPRKEHIHRKSDINRFKFKYLLCFNCEKLPLFPVCCNNCNIVYCIFCISEIKYTAYCNLMNNIKIYSELNYFNTLTCKCCLKSIVPLKYIGSDLIKEYFDLNIKCTRSFCFSILNFKDYLKHFFVDCNYIIIKCKNTLCTEEMSKLNFKEHLNNCVYRDEICPSCNKTMRIQELLSHKNFCIGKVNIFTSKKCSNNLAKSKFLYNYNECNLNNTNISYTKKRNISSFNLKRNNFNNIKCTYKTNRKSLSAFNYKLDLKDKDNLSNKLCNNTKISELNIYQSEIDSIKDNSNIKTNTINSLFHNNSNNKKSCKTKDNKYIFYLQEKLNLLQKELNSKDKLLKNINLQNQDLNNKINKINEKNIKLEEKVNNEINQVLLKQEKCLEYKINYLKCELYLKHKNMLINEYENILTCHICGESITANIKKNNNKLLEKDIRNEAYLDKFVLSETYRSFRDVKQNKNKLTTKILNKKKKKISVYNGDKDSNNDVSDYYTNSSRIKNIKVINNNNQYYSDNSIRNADLNKSNSKFNINSNILLNEYTIENKFKDNFKILNEVNTKNNNKKHNFYIDIKNSINKKYKNSNKIKIVDSKYRTHNKISHSIANIEDISRNKQVYNIFNTPIKFNNTFKDNENEFNKSNKLNTATFKLPLNIDKSNKTNNFVININKGTIENCNNDDSNSSLVIRNKKLKLKDNISNKSKIDLTNKIENTQSYYSTNKTVNIKTNIDDLICYICNKYSCKNCSIICNCCTKLTCTEDIYYCIQCSNSFCVNDILICKGCERKFCSRCFMSYPCNQCSWGFDTVNKDIDVLFNEEKNYKFYLRKSFECKPSIVIGSKLLNKGEHKFSLNFCNIICKYTDVGFFTMKNEKSYLNLISSLYKVQYNSIREDVKKVSIKSIAPFLFLKLGEFPIIVTVNCNSNVILFEVDTFKYEKIFFEKNNYYLLYVLACNNSVKLNRILISDSIKNN